MNTNTTTAIPTATPSDSWVANFSRTDTEILANWPRKSASLNSPWTVDPQKEKKSYPNEWLQNSTVQQEYPREIDQKVEVLFEAAKEQVFEDGMESDFSKGLLFLVEKYGDAVIAVLTRLIVTEQVNAEIASETLRWLGRIEHSISYHHRLWLLERSLFCSSARVRDGAALGLASLDDPHAIPHLKRAIQRESYAELREDMEQVLEQLELAN